MNETGTAVHTEPAAPAARWAIVEIMGRRIVAGRLTYGTPPYTAGVEVEIPLPDGSYLPEYYSAGAIFALRIVPEAVARQQGVPYHVREITRALLPAPAKTTPVRPQEREGLYVEIDERLRGLDYDATMRPETTEAWRDRLGAALESVDEMRGLPGCRDALITLAADVLGAIESYDRVDAEFDLDGYTPDEDDGEDDEVDLLSDPESGGPDDEPHGGGCP